MPLYLFRRHAAGCRFRSQRFKGCGCPIYVRGTLGGERVKRSLDLADWQAATLLIQSWEKAGRIQADGARQPELRSAVERFLEDCRARHLSHESARKYENLLLSRMLNWAEQRGRQAIEGWTIGVVREFRQSWSDGPLYALKNLERLRAFFRFCVSEGWIEKNPASGLKPPRLTGRQVMPFSDQEMTRILGAVDRYPGNRARMRAFVLTMRWTGLRISDATALRRSALREGKVWVRTEKTGIQVWVPVPEETEQALLGLPETGERFFWNGQGKLQTRVGNWARYLGSVFRKAGIQGGHSHRFRHTFAAGLLSAGVSVDNVAALLGNSPRIVQKHYAPWIRARQEALEKEVRAAWQKC